MKHLLTIIILLLTTLSFAATLTVKQDGTGDYTIIQDAIDIAVDSDTILVWPGTYYENIDFIGKNITLVSLMLTTGDENFKYSTIIDGNNTGSCIVFMTGETDAILFGFTLQHGSGYRNIYIDETFGGGVFMDNSSASIYNCIIKDNSSTLQTGGVHCAEHSNLFLSGTSIFRNQSNSNGGLGIGYKSITTFDSLNKCSIYNNYAGAACDIMQGNHEIEINFILDTFSVLLPTPYFIYSSDGFGYQIENYTFTTNDAYFDPIDADVYVNPFFGNNNNSGISPDEAFGTIAYALSSIAIDTINKNTIRLANGTYSDTANNERFPLNIRPFTRIIGESMDGTILDGRHLIRLARGNTEVSDYCFKNMTMKRGGYVKADGTQLLNAFAKLYQQNDNIIFDSISFSAGWSSSKPAIYSIRCNNVLFNNCVFKNTVGGVTLRLDSVDEDTMFVHNCKFTDNKPDFYNPLYTIGRALSVIGRQSVKLITNSLFTNNDQQTVGNYSFSNLYLVNCTFSNNTLETNTATSIASHDANLYMYNCISYNEGNQPLALTYNETQDTVVMEIYNSLIEGGEESIYVQPGLTRLHYDETNIEGDPIFYGGAEYPYNLSDLSPCIDAGTLDLPDWIELPDTDLAGNPRVVGGAIDMGAYEWNPTVGINEYQPIKKEKDKLLLVAPNPFSTNTVISSKYPVKSHVKMEVYNNYGQRVKVFMNEVTLPGESHIIWDGTNYNNQALPTGVYYVVMFVDDMEVESVKVIKR